MGGHFNYEFFDFPPFGRHFGDHFGFGHCGRGFGPFRGPVGPFDHHDRSGCPFGPPRPHRGHDNSAERRGPPFEGHGFHSDCRRPRPGHRHGPHRGPDNDCSPDRHDRPHHGPRPCGSPDHSPDRHQGPHHGPRKCGGPDHSPERHHEPHHGPRPHGRPNHGPHGPYESPRCGRRRSPEHFGARYGPDCHSHWGYHQGPERFGPWKPCCGFKRPSPYERPGCPRRRRNWNCENGPCCTREDRNENNCDRKKGYEPCSDKDKDQNVTGDTILVQRIVVEKAPRPNSV